MTGATVVLRDGRELSVQVIEQWATDAPDGTCTVHFQRRRWYLDGQPVSKAEADRLASAELGHEVHF